MQRLHWLTFILCFSILALGCSDDSSNETDNDNDLSLTLAGNITTLQDKIETASILSEGTLDTKTSNDKDLDSFWDTVGVDSLFDGTTDITAREWMEQIIDPTFVSNTGNPKTPFGRFITMLSIGCALDTLIDVDSSGLIELGEHDLDVTSDLMVDCGGIGFFATYSTETTATVTALSNGRYGRKMTATIDNPIGDSLFTLQYGVVDNVIEVAAIQDNVDSFDSVLSVYIKYNKDTSFFQFEFYAFTEGGTEVDMHRIIIDSNNNAYLLGAIDYLGTNDHTKFSLAGITGSTGTDSSLHFNYNNGSFDGKACVDRSNNNILENDTLDCEVTAIDLTDATFFQSKFDQYADLNAVLDAFNDDYEPGWSDVFDMPTDFND